MRDEPLDDSDQKRVDLDQRGLLLLDADVESYMELLCRGSDASFMYQYVVLKRHNALYAHSTNRSSRVMERRNKSKTVVTSPLGTLDRSSHLRLPALSD